MKQFFLSSKCLSSSWLTTSFSPPLLPPELLAALKNSLLILTIFPGSPITHLPLQILQCYVMGQLHELILFTASTFGNYKPNLSYTILFLFFFFGLILLFSVFHFNIWKLWVGKYLKLWLCTYWPFKHFFKFNSQQYSQWFFIFLSSFASFLCFFLFFWSLVLIFYSSHRSCNTISKGLTPVYPLIFSFYSSFSLLKQLLLPRNRMMTLWWEMVIWFTPGSHIE